MATVSGWPLVELDRRTTELVELLLAAWQEVARAIRELINGQDFVSVSDAGTVPRVWADRAQTPILDYIETVYVDSAGRVIDDLGLSDIYAVSDDILAKYMEEATNRLAAISDDVWADVQAEIVEGVRQGESIPEIADRVSAAATVSEGRAETIARTEVHSAHESGTHAQVLAIDPSGVKVWLATDDTRTRPTHREAEGQRVPIGEPFNVGGVPLRYPGDLFGASDEVINCRCTSLYDFDAPLQQEGEPVTASTAYARDKGGRFARKESVIQRNPAAPSHVYRSALSDGDVIAESLDGSQRFRWDFERRRFVLETRTVGGTWSETELLTKKRTYDRVKSGAWYAPDTEPVTAHAEMRTPFSVGDRVRVVGEPHELGHDVGVIVEQVGNAYAILFDGSDEPHRWYVAEELETEEEWDGVLTLDDNEEPLVPNVLIPLEALQERDVNLPGGAGHSLREYWVRGPGAARIRWGTEGSMDRCIRFLRQYVRDPGGLCAEYHHAATGEWPRGGAIPSESDTVTMVYDEMPDSESGGMAEECPEGEHKMPDGTCMPDSEMTAMWEGILTVEGIESGDGRMFALNALTWDEPPLPLMWQKVTSHGGRSDVSVRVGSIDRIWRESDPSGRSGVALIKGAGTIDLGSEDGREVHRRMRNGYMRGNSVDVDSVKGADVELVYADDTEDLFAEPELTIFTRGRIRATTLVEIPAFTEARLSLVEHAELVASMATETFGAVSAHDTPTIDETWDADETVKRLPSPMTTDTARDVFAWFDSDEVEDGELPKFAGKLPHHEVGSDGTPGAANLTACSNAIGALHGARGGVDIPVAERRAVYDHLAAHLRDADREPPPFGVEDAEALTAASVAIEIPDLPPRAWFDAPIDVTPEGALTITPDGRIYGYVAPAGVRHRSFHDRAQYVPSKKVDYTRFMGGQTLVDDGGRVSTGNITMNCGHASTNVPMSSTKAAEHYDNTCSVVATIRVGENRHGTWFAGALLPDVDADQIRRIMACRLSGDWRTHLDRSGWREFVAALLVPVPGFPMPRKAASVQVAEGALVASSVPVKLAEVPESVADAPEPVAELDKASHAERVRALRSKVTANANRLKVLTLIDRLNKGESEDGV